MGESYVGSFSKDRLGDGVVNKGGWRRSGALARTAAWALAWGGWHRWWCVRNNCGVGNSVGRRQRGVLARTAGMSDRMVKGVGDGVGRRQSGRGPCQQRGKSKNGGARRNGAASA